VLAIVLRLKLSSVVIWIVIEWEPLMQNITVLISLLKSPNELTESLTNKVEFSYNCWLCLIYKMIMNISLFGLYWINIFLVLFLCIRTAKELIRNLLLFTD